MTDCDVEDLIKNIEETYRMNTERVEYNYMSKMKFSLYEDYKYNLFTIFIII